MLPQEFYERTKVHLSNEEYVEVERMYNAVSMDKDAFCKMWLQYRDCQLVQELMVAIRKQQDEISDLSDKCNKLKIELAETKSLHESEMNQNDLTHRIQMKEFCDKLVKAGEYDFPSAIYDVIEEEYGIDFIIKSKWEQSIELTESEITYLVKKL